MFYIGSQQFLCFDALNLSFFSDCGNFLRVFFFLVLVSLFHFSFLYFLKTFKIAC